MNEHEALKALLDAVQPGMHVVAGVDAQVVNTCRAVWEANHAQPVTASADDDTDSN